MNDFANTGTGHDIAVSFPDSERQYVEQVVEACRERGVSVLYDRDRTNEWWSRNADGGAQVRFFVPFVSTGEFSAAMLAAVKQGDGYVLPVLTGDTPPDLLHPHIDYLRRAGHTPEALADLLADKVDQASSAGQQPREVGEVVKHAMHAHRPAAVPADFSKYEEQHNVLGYLGSQFLAAAPQLRQRGVVCTVRPMESLVAIRVERGGETVYALDIRRGGIGGDETINFVAGLHDPAGSCTSGWAHPFYDKEAGTAKLRLHDLSVFGAGDVEPRVYTKESLFVALWERIGSVLDAQVSR